MKSKLNIDYNMINTVLMVIILIIVVYCCVKKQNENFSEPCILYQMDENGNCAILGDNESYTGPMRCGSCPGQLGMKEAGGANWSEDLANLSKGSETDKELYMVASGLLMVFMTLTEKKSWIDKNWSPEKTAAGETQPARGEKAQTDVKMAINYLNTIWGKNITDGKLTQVDDSDMKESEDGKTYETTNCTLDTFDKSHVCLLNISIPDSLTYNEDGEVTGGEKSSKVQHIGKLSDWIKNTLKIKEKFAKNLEKIETAFKDMLKA